MAYELYRIELQVIKLINVLADEGKMGKTTHPTYQIVEGRFQAQRVLKHHKIDRTN